MMAGKITTLYIDDTSIRLVVTSGKRISKLADIPLDESFADVSIKVREAEIAAKIKQLFKANKVTTKKVILGLSGLHCLSRPIILPQLPRAMLEEAVMREAKRVLPVPPEQLHLSWQIISATEDKMQGFMVAIPRQIADTLLSILHQVGLKPYLMDIKPLALARLVKVATAIVVDVQSKEFDIVVMANGVPQPIRTISFPEETLSLSDKLLLVKDELKRTLQFYNSNAAENPIDASVPIFVSGELVDETEMCESLASELGYQVLPLLSPLKCPKQLAPAHYLVNIGLALKELRKEAGPLSPNLNALPVPYQSKPISVRRVMALPATAIAAGLIVLLVMTIQDAAANIYSTRSQLDTTGFIIEQRQSQRKEMMENIEALKKKLANTEESRNVFLGVLDSIGNKGDNINDDLETTVDNLVSGIGLRNIAHSGNDLRLSGQSASEVEILEYVRNLDASGRFAEITIAAITRVEVEGEGEGEEVEGEGEEVEGEDEENTEMSFNLVLELKGQE